MNDRVIINKKGRMWHIPEGAKGIPLEEAWPNTKIPDSLKGALIYDIGGEKVIALQNDTEEDD